MDLLGNDYDQFVTKFKNYTGIDLSLYKESQMKRRLITFLEKSGYKSFLDYYRRLTLDQQLLHELLDRITINVTEFYRNSDRWKVLENKILPQLLNRNRKIKIWSAACSTGEEPYTIAMILSQYIPLENITILATDIDEKVLKHAKMGIYSERSLAEVPDHIKKKFFTLADGHYRIRNDIKGTVTFKKHNLLNDFFEKEFDLIVCRNVLIYFTEDAKDILYSKFNSSLKPGGFLFLGGSEHISSPAKFSFEVEDLFFYRKSS